MKLKRLNVPWATQKKSFKFITAPRGSHPKDFSIPLLVIVRDVLKIAENAKEARHIIKSRKVTVDGKICRDIRRGIGLLDVVGVGGLFYRLSKKKKMILIEVNSSESNLKICKIKSKNVLKSGKIQLNLHDGKNIILNENKYSTNDSLLIELPSLKVNEHLEFKEGSLVMITSPAHGGEIATIDKIERGMNKRLELKSGDGKKFEAPFDSVIVIGKEKPLIKVNLDE